MKKNKGFDLFNLARSSSYDLSGMNTPRKRRTI